MKCSITNNWQITLYIVFSWLTINSFLSARTFNIDPNLKFIAGKKISFKIPNNYNQDDKYIFEDNNYKLQIGLLAPEFISIVQDATGLHVSMILPYTYQVIGKQTLNVINNLDVPIGDIDIIVDGLIPSLNDETGTYLNVGEGYKTILLTGNNLSSIKQLRFESTNIILDNVEPFQVTSDTQIKIKIRASQQSGSNQKLNIVYATKQGDLSLSTSLILPTYNLNTKPFTLRYDKIYKDDLERNNDIDLSLTIPVSKSDNQVFTLKCNDDKIIVIDEPISFIDNKNGSIRITIDPTISTGKKQFTIYEGNNKFYQAQLRIIDKPRVDKLYVDHKSNNNLFIKPNSQQKIYIEGNNLEDLELICENEDITFVADRRSTNNKKMFAIIVDPSVKYGSYDVVLNRNKDIYYPEYSYALTVLEHQKICDLNSIIKIVNGKGEFLSFDNSDFLRFPSDSKLIVRLSGDKLTEEFGSQAVNIKASLYDEEGALLETKEYKNPRLQSNYALIGTSHNQNNRAKLIEQWDLEKEFSSKLINWRKIIIEFRHDNAYYIGTGLFPEFSQKEILLTGSDFYSTIALPPILIAIAEKTQILPLNIGYGVKYHQRYHDGKKKWWAAGAYIAGLNNLSTEETNNDSKLLGKGSAGLLLIGDIHLLNREKSLKLPLQLGAGVAWPSQGTKRVFFGILGLGLEYNF